MTVTHSDISSETVRQPSVAGNLGRIGNLVTRLALTDEEITEAQRLRYRVFYEEMSATPSPAQRHLQLDVDGHDRLCRHQLILDLAAEGPRAGNEPAKQPDPECILAGTQRLFLPGNHGGANGFHSQDEFDVEGLSKHHGALRFLELGRSAILPPYRTRRTAELMWQGTWAFVREHAVDVMVGCASFHATDFKEVGPALAGLAPYAADRDWSISPTSSDARRLSEFAAKTQNSRTGLHLMPPLLKGYLRLGAMVSDHAVRDERFGTIDVFIILPVSHISERYIRYYGPDASRHRDRI